MRLFIIDESSEYRSALAGTLRSRSPAAETVEWGPRRQGHPGRVQENRSRAAVLLVTVRSTCAKPGSP